MSYHPWQTMKIGDESEDVKHMQQLLSGANRIGYDADPGPVSGVLTDATAAAVQRMKFHLGYPTRDLSPLGGQRLRSFLVDKTSPAFVRLPAAYRAKMLARRGKTFQIADGVPYPLAHHGKIIGRPYLGTHDHPKSDDDKHNWESCNAIDISIPVGTTVIAVADGTIGSQIGALSSSDPALLGQRLHLITADNEWYYAHLSHLSVAAGRPVSKGDHLGRSGSANGSPHLHLGQRHGDPGALIGSPSSGYVDHHFPD